MFHNREYLDNVASLEGQGVEIENIVRGHLGNRYSFFLARLRMLLVLFALNVLHQLRLEDSQVVVKDVLLGNLASDLNSNLDAKVSKNCNLGA
jgi:hypothetical protein